jgi:hypothetical protein
MVSSREANTAPPSSSAVIEQRLTDDGSLQWLGCTAGLENAHHRNRVGGRNQHAEQQAVEEADLPAEQVTTQGNRTIIPTSASPPLVTHKEKSGFDVTFFDYLYSSEHICIT